MNSITPTELCSRLDNGEEIQIIDVREPHETEICSINGMLIPMGEILENVDKIRKDVPVVIHCRSGKRAAAVVMTLEKQFGFTNVMNLTGGILQYAEEVDPSLEQY